MISLSSSHGCTAYFPNVLIPEQHEDLPELPKSVDTSEALFSMYLERSDHDDREVTQRWKGESDAILIFVRHFYHLYVVVLLCDNTEGHRPVFSQPLLRLFLPFLSRIFGRIHKTLQHSISRIFTFYSPMLLALSPSSSPGYLTHLNFHRRHTRSWLTHFGY